MLLELKGSKSRDDLRSCANAKAGRWELRRSGRRYPSVSVHVPLGTQTQPSNRCVCAFFYQAPLNTQISVSVMVRILSDMTVHYYDHVFSRDHGLREQAVCSTLALTTIITSRSHASNLLKYSNVLTSNIREVGRAFVPKAQLRKEGYDMTMTMTMT